MNISLFAFAPENLVSRDGSGSSVPRQPAHLHTQAESGAYLRDSSRITRRHPYIYLNRLTPSGQSRVYRVTQLHTDGVHCRERWHKASKPQGSSERVLPWQVTMDQLTYAYVLHTVRFPHWCNGKSLSWMGLTRERWCCTMGLMSRLDMNTCQTNIKTDMLLEYC